ISILLAVTTQRPRPPRDRNPAVPPALSTLILQLLEKEPAKRPPSAREVIAALDRTQPVKPAPGGANRRRWIRTAMVAGVLAVAAVAATVVIIRDRYGNKVADVPVPPGGKVDVIEGKKDTPAGPPQPPVDDAWIKQVAALPTDKQVEAVVAELKRRNPNFDGQ